MTSALSDPLIGRLVDGRYRVRARIARGGMATVYVATDLRLERRIALKVMHGHLSDDQVFQSRFIQEARAAARLADPHVVNVFDQGQDDGIAYLVMEYLPGITLRELLREQKRLSVAQTIAIMDATLSGLAAAHRAGIVHRDVKPENILLAEDGRIKIGDFGLARATTANTASGQMLLGTIAYLAPELVTRGTADARSDIYALGIMLYEMLAGEQPYRGEQPMQIAYRHANDSVPRPSARNPQVPEPLDELVLWATERDPEERPIDAGVMLDRLREIEREIGVTPSAARASAPPTAPRDSGDLTKVLATSPTTAATTALAPAPVTDNATRLRRRASRRGTRRAWTLVLVLLLAALAGGAGWWFGQGPGSLIAVPDVAGGTYDEAAAALGELGLGATAGTDQYDRDVPAGQVLSTDPPSGSLVDREATIAIGVSLGPRPTGLDALAGASLEQVEETLNSAGVAIEETAERFGDESDQTVVSVTRITRDGVESDISQGGEVYDGDTARVVVSVGPVPDVSGLSQEAARETLANAGLQVAAEVQTEYSTAIPADRVIRIAERGAEGAWVPGDTTTLVLSLGPELFEVPDVMGETLADARTILTDAGFEVSYNRAWDVFPIAIVTTQSPEGGSMRERDTEVRIGLSFTDNDDE